MGEGREGDWECGSCTNKNYAFRSFCNRCKQPRILVDNKTPVDSKWLPRIGDWICSGARFDSGVSNDDMPYNGGGLMEASLPVQDTAVRRQAMWSNLAHEMTAEFRGLCAEEAYLQQELEKLQDLRNKAKMDGELWDDCVSSSSGQNSHLVSKATRLWESLLARKSQHKVLASGPIEDLIAHREHRYQISGSALLSAMDQSS
ncbi:hypothetical protein IFM89_032238 [Coptis chinensis]|uniref:RanBP2-type domain-containing protein n=1 Tax=Coptis chinensis TaxID=261450 RepID=A0A835HZS6_9MAGN|nr:hypothetical protein IFM89_032238 [Coptis chinensis]